MHFRQGSMAKARGDISKQGREKKLKTTPSISSKVKNHQKLLNALFLNVILKTFQVKIKNQVIIAQSKIMRIFQMKVKSTLKSLNAMMMMMNFSLQVKKKM
jgi:hypothetical protein